MQLNIWFNNHKLAIHLIFDPLFSPGERAQCGGGAFTPRAETLLAGLAGLPGWLAQNLDLKKSQKN